MLSRIAIFLVVLPLAVVEPATAQDYQRGVAAYKRGDYAVALGHLRPFAEQGYAAPQSMLGFIYANGRGVLRDYAEAVKWLRKAAGQGIAVAQHNLGVRYRLGQGVPQSYPEAAKWFYTAAEQGHPLAQLNLAAMYADGLGVSRDLGQAYMWFTIAVARGKQRGAKGQNFVARGMTPRQITEAKRLAWEWLEKHKNN